MTVTQVQVHVPGNHLMVGVLGQRDEHLRMVEDNFGDANIHVRGNEISVDGPQANMVGQIFEEFVHVLEAGQRLDSATALKLVDMVKEHENPREILDNPVLRAPNGRLVRAKSAGQLSYIQTARANVITFAIGPAGTGKTWLAVAMAVEALASKEVRRIVLTRPAVEAGERLGFLPGDLMAKIDPYLAPLYDALFDLLDHESAERYLENKSIEVAPLAFMRGRTLRDSFIILDEAQNTTPEQMKMFLTRIGGNSKAVITGDLTQIDVGGGASGLLDAERSLRGINSVAFASLTGRDITRHPVVKDIVAAYDQRDSARRNEKIERDNERRQDADSYSKDRPDRRGQGERNP